MVKAGRHRVRRIVKLKESKDGLNTGERFLQNLSIVVVGGIILALMVKICFF